MQVGDFVTLKKDRTIVGCVVKIAKEPRTRQAGKRGQGRRVLPVWVAWADLDGEAQQEYRHTLEVVSGASRRLS